MVEISRARKCPSPGGLNGERCYMARPRKQQELSVVVGGFLRGNSVAFRAIKTKITQYVYHQGLGADRDRDDLVSDILQILYENLKQKKFRGDSITALSVYIYSIVRHRMNRIRRHRERYAEFDEEIAQRETDQPSPAEVVGVSDLTRKVYRTLDSGCRELLQLKFERRWSDQEIADYMGKTKNATSTAISRCLKKAADLDFVRELM